MTQNERELGWDDEIVNDGPEFIVLPAGDYNFTVAGFKRGRFQGSEKMPACNQANLELKIQSPENGEVTVFHRLLLHTRTEGFLSNFFTGIGQKKKGEPLRMNWNAVVGSTGRCKLIINKYTDKEGNERTNNQVDTFYDPAEVPQVTQQPTYQQPAQQVPTQPPAQPQQPTTQAPFPTNTPPQQGGGFTPGQF
ncbi:hypothetical protein [Sporosarcina sp. 6E9]|uniref:hypothetical protein n=1 Tax=Sporosarcina sp. 6E9 TaxID=2819235 RepID=UPI001ACB6E50|nr:hypothetical protein [Sporosarcina sp. 6E9]MBO1909677.1 hypothetical protein [Microvirga sp. 3-52]